MASLGAADPEDKPLTTAGQAAQTLSLCSPALHAHLRQAAAAQSVSRLTPARAAVECGMLGVVVHFPRRSPSHSLEPKLNRVDSQGA